jgi:chemotaxis signal transduction protein
MKYFTLVLLSLILLTLSCKQKSTSTSGQNEAKEKDTITSIKKYPGQQKMEEINTVVNDLEEVHSLRWEKISDEQTIFTEVIAFLNDDGIPMKIVEQYSNGNFQDQGERHFYLENNKLVAFEDKKDSWLDSNTFVYEEIQTFYNEQEPVMTRKRSAMSVSDIETAEWKEIRPESHTLTKVNKILSGEGEFETHFISVIEAQSGLFLLLGENKKDNRYQTAVRVDEKTPFLKDLLANLDAYKYRPIEIQFGIEGGAGQPQFQVLKDARWKDAE